MEPQRQVFVALQNRQVGLGQLRLHAVQGRLVEDWEGRHDESQSFEKEATFGVDASNNLKKMFLFSFVANWLLN
jgi:hypothetical protein